MKWTFWAAAALVAYTYLGYLITLYLRSRTRCLPIATAPIIPTVSIVVAVRNEAETITSKLQNLAELDYPSDLMEIVVVSDGSTDGTNEKLRSHSEIRTIVLDGHGGKACALNAGVSAAKNEIVVFTDARQMIEPGALKSLMSNFADPQVGCASGELMLRSSDSASSTEGIGIYWKLEKKIRSLESATGSVVGATGAFYAVRRNLLVTLPNDTILDDVYTPMHVAKSGFRVIFEPNARAWDVPVSTARNEFRRKVRTLTGNYQLIQLAPWILSSRNPLLFEFVSHKLLRLVVPFALLLILISSMLVQEPFYRAVFALQALFYAIGILALIGMKTGPINRAANFSLSFMVLNAAAVLAFFNLIRGKQKVWV